MIDADGTASGMQNQLILRASPDRMREVEAIVQQLDIARVNRRITVNTSNSNQSQLNRTVVSRKRKIDNITTGFAVRPRTIGNQVELEITPRIASLTNQGMIDFEKLSTTLRISLNEWVDIGGTMQHHDDISRQILGRQNTASSQHSSIMFKVD